MIALMKVIELSQGWVAIVDDWFILPKYKYFYVLEKSHHYGYAKRSIYINGKKRQCPLHKDVLEQYGCPQGKICDHINRDELDQATKMLLGDKAWKCLDYRVANLRPATYSQNRMNTIKKQAKRGVPTSSRWKGVYKKGNKWGAHICRDYKRRFLGSFKSEDDAAHAYDKAAKELFGQHALLNFP
jgi:hypothetical protein